MERESMRTREESWQRDVDNKLSGASYPLDRSEAEERLGNLTIGGESASRYFDRMEWPVNSREDLVSQFRQAREGSSSSRY